VLSEESKLVLESTLQGEILGMPLNVSQANQPEGIYFAPNGRELWIASEPNELLVYKTSGSNRISFGRLFSLFVLAGLVVVIAR
jgi:uncharacterized protein YjiK